MSYFQYTRILPAHIPNEASAQQTQEIKQQDTVEVQNTHYHPSPENTTDWHVKEALISFIAHHKKEDLLYLSKPSKHVPEAKTQLTINNRKFLVESDENTHNLKATHCWGTGVFSILIRCVFHCFFRHKIKSVNDSQKLLQKYLNDPHIQAFFQHILENYEIFEPANSEYSEEVSRKNLCLCVGALKANLRDYLQGNTVNLKPLHANFVLELISTDT